MSKFDCICAGGATYDLLFLVDKVPLSDERIEALKIVQSGGGPAATAAVALQSLGKKTALISAVGKDEAGHFIYNELKNRNIDVSNLYMLEDKSSPISAIHIEKSTGKRAITAYFGGSLKYLEPDKVDLAILNNTNCIHLDGNHIELALHIAKYCHENTSTKVSLDGGNISYENAMRVLPYVDIFIPDDKSAEKALGHTDFEKACRHFYEMGPRIVCITMGDKGLIAYDGHDYIKIGAFPVNVVDTTGAGDNFHGAFLYGYLERWPLLKALKFASAFAALTCLGLGGRSNIPSFKETEDFMNSYDVKC